jgi:hypothetical protein
MSNEELQMIEVVSSISPQQEYEEFIKNVAGVESLKRESKDFLTSINDMDIEKMFESPKIELGSYIFNL